jgi:hypothetical protein
VLDLTKTEIADLNPTYDTDIFFLCCIEVGDTCNQKGGSKKL